MRKHIGIIAAAGAAVALAASGGGYALAADSAPAAVSIPAGTLHGCVAGSSRVMEHVYESNTSGTVCPSGSFLVYWGVTGPKGAPGPSGVVSTTRKQLITMTTAGALENPTATILTDGDTINSYYSGDSEITVPAGGETLDVYAFGYDSDTGEGSYALNSAVITATQLQTAG
jgi:hypothetical protein